MKRSPLLLLLLIPLGFIAIPSCIQYYFDNSQRPWVEKVAGTMDLMGRMIVQKADPNRGDLPPAVVQAVKANNIDVVRQALDNGLDINAHDYTIGMTPLHHAASERKLDMVKMLIARGADVNAFDHDHSTPLHFAAYKRGNSAVLKYLLAHGATPDLVDDEHLTPHDYARLAGDEEMMSLLPPPAAR